MIGYYWKRYLVVCIMLLGWVQTIKTEACLLVLPRQCKRIR